MAETVTLTIAIAKGVITAGKIGWATGVFISNATQAPNEIARVKTEASIIEANLRHLQAIILDENITRGANAQYVQLVDLATVVEATVITLAKLENTINLVKGRDDYKVLDRLKWAWHKDDVQKLLNELHANATYLQLIFDVLQHKGQTQAIELSNELKDGVEKLLRADADRARRMEGLEEMLMRFLNNEAESIRPSAPARDESEALDDAFALSDDAETIRPEVRQTEEIITVSDIHRMTELDRLLASFRVYKRADKRGSWLSLDGSVNQTWSFFSGLSLAVMSNLSVIALPLQISSSSIQDDQNTWPALAGVKTLKDRRAILDMAVSSGGRYLAARSNDRYITLWDISADQPALATTLRGVFTEVAFSPDGQYLAAGSRDGSAKIWLVSTGQQVHKLIHDGAVYSVAFSPDGDWLATGSLSGVQIWDPGRGSFIAETGSDEDICQSVRFSPDGMTLASMSRGGTITIWNVPDLKFLRAFGHVPSWNYQYPLSFSSDGKVLATTTPTTLETQSALQMFDPSTGVEVRKLDSVGNVGDLAFLGSSRLIVLYTVTGIKVCDIDSGVKRILPVNTRGYTGYVAVSSDGNLIANSTLGSHKIFLSRLVWR